jgi:hypothetical protein
VSRLESTARAVALSVLAAVLVAGCKAAKVSDPVDEEDFVPAAAREAPLKLPPYPKEQDLLRFDLEPRTAFEYFVDGSSITVLDEGIVRFTVVSRTANVANVTYEGLRCNARERKLYAHANRDGAWVVAKNPGWVPVGPRLVGAFRHELYWNYFCPGKRIIDSPGEGVRALRLGGHPDARPEGSGAQ